MSEPVAITVSSPTPVVANVVVPPAMAIGPPSPNGPYVAQSEKGAASGVAALDNTGKLAESELPSSVVSSSADGFAPSVIWLDSTPEFYGAKGDGATDDTAAFQALSKALNEKGGGTGRVSAKTYIVDGYVWESGVLWEGRGSGTILKAKAGSANSAMITCAVGRIRDGGWRNMQILPNGNAGQHAFYLYAQESSETHDGGVWNCEFENLRVGAGASEETAWEGCCFWFRGGYGTTNLPHQFNSFRNVQAIRVNTGAYATTSRSFKATGQCGQFSFSGSCILNGQHAYEKVGTNVELSREFLYSTTLSAEAAAGTTELTVASTTGLETNKQFLLGDGSTGEVLTVSSIVGSVVYLSTATKWAHASGTRLYLLSGTVAAPAEEAPGVFEFGECCSIQYGDLGFLVDTKCQNIDLGVPWLEGLNKGWRVRTVAYSINVHGAHLANVSEGESNGRGEATVGSKTITKATGTWANGDAINGPGIPAGTTVESGGGTETLTLTAVVTSNGTEGAQTINLVKGGRGEGYIANYEGSSTGHVFDHTIYGASDRGVIGTGNVRVDSPTRVSGPVPNITSTGIVPTVASAGTISVSTAREIYLTGITTVKTILGQHATGETLRIRIAGAGIRLQTGGNLRLQTNAEIHLYPEDIVTFIRSDLTTTWELVGVQRRECYGALEITEANNKIAAGEVKIYEVTVQGCRVGDYCLAEYTKSFSANNILIRAECRVEGKVRVQVINNSGAEVVLEKGAFIKAQALRPT